MYRIEIKKYIKGTVRQVGYLLELYRDARSPEYKTFHKDNKSHHSTLR